MYPSLKSLEVEASKPEEVFEALEKILRPESNQTLARFQFRSMKQKQSESIDAYMSKLQLALQSANIRMIQMNCLRINFCLVCMIKRFKTIYWVRSLSLITV